MAALMAGIRKEVIAYKLYLISHEIEKDLCDVSQQQLSDQTMFVLCSALVYVNSKDLLQVMSALKMLSELHPELVPSLNVTIANAAILHALTQKDDPERALRELREELGSNSKIIPKLQECLFQKPIPDDWDSMLESMVVTLLGNVVSLVRELITHTSGVVVPAGNDATETNPSHPITIEPLFSQIEAQNEETNNYKVTDNCYKETKAVDTHHESSTTDCKKDEPSNMEDTHHETTTDCKQHELEDVSDTHHESSNDCKKDKSNSMEDLTDELLEEEVSSDGQGDELPPTKAASAISDSTNEGDQTMSSSQGRLSPEKKHLDTSPLQSGISSDDSFNEVYALDKTTLPKKIRSFWTADLTNELVDGVNKLGEGKWAHILSFKRKTFPMHFNNKTLRYKWKNLLKYGYVVKEGSEWVLR